MLWRGWHSLGSPLSSRWAFSNPISNARRENLSVAGLATYMALRDGRSKECRSTNRRSEKLTAPCRVTAATVTASSDTHPADNSSPLPRAPSQARQLLSLKQVIAGQSLMTPRSTVLWGETAGGPNRVFGTVCVRTVARNGPPGGLAQVLHFGTDGGRVRACTTGG